MTTVFFAKNGTFKMDAAADITISATTVLDTAFASAVDVTGQFKDITIDAENVAVDKIDLVGTSSSFQNCELEEKPPSLYTISGTLVMPGDEVMESEIFGAGTNAPTSGTTHTTYRMGLAIPIKLAFLINVDDGVDEVNFACTNAECTKYNPKLGGADGHFEVDFEIKCLARDFYGPQFKN